MHCINLRRSFMCMCKILYQCIFVHGYDHCMYVHVLYQRIYVHVSGLGHCMWVRFSSIGKVRQNQTVTAFHDG